jgi:uncharacterized protein YcfL
MKKLLTISLLFLAVCSAKSQENFRSIDMMLLEKAPVTTHAHMDSLLVNKSAESRVIKKTNASGGDTFFMYHQDKLGLTLNFSKDKELVSALIPSLRMHDIELELLGKKFTKSKLKSYKDAAGNVLKRYKWSKKSYSFRFITFDYYEGIELLTKLSDEY